MKLRILSDLHVEFFPFQAPPAHADAVILAGDIGVGLQGLHWAAHTFDPIEGPVIYVPGNHEYYGCDMASWETHAKTWTETTHVQVCNPRSTLLERPGERPVRILGVTLWTDFAIFGEDKVVSCAERTQLALADYRAIQTNGHPLRWTDTLALHQQALAWLKSECLKARAAGEKVVVVTHHSPSLKSSLPVYVKDPVTAGFASNLEAFAGEFVDCWVHGHHHNSALYRIGGCLVVANPRGYPRHRWNPDTTFENPKFNPTLVVEV